MLRVWLEQYRTLVISIFHHKTLSGHEVRLLQRSGAGALEHDAGGAISNAPQKQTEPEAHADGLADVPGTSHVNALHMKQLR